MNLFRLSSLLCGAMLLLCTACTPPYVEEEPIGMDTYPRRFFFNTILEPREVHMARVPTVRMHHPTEHSELIRQGRVIEVYLRGRQYRDASLGGFLFNAQKAKEESAGFEAVATARGDGHYYAPKNHSTDGGAYKHTLTSGIRSLSLTSVGGYSATYPAGSDLTPITQAYWVQVERKANRSVTQEELHRIWQEYGTQIQPPFNGFDRTWHWTSLADLKDIDLPALNGQQPPIGVQMDYNTGVLCYLVLKELPEQGEQTLRLTLTLMDGRELTRDLFLRLGN